MEIKYYKICRVKCKCCGDVLEHINQTKDERNSLFYCHCGKVGLDPSPVMYRIIGAEEDFEDLSEEWKN